MPDLPADDADGMPPALEFVALAVAAALVDTAETPFSEGDFEEAHGVCGVEAVGELDG